MELLSNLLNRRFPTPANTPSDLASNKILKCFIDDTAMNYSSKAFRLLTALRTKSPPTSGVRRPLYSLIRWLLVLGSINCTSLSTARTPSGSFNILNISVMPPLLCDFIVKKFHIFCHDMTALFCSPFHRSPRWPFNLVQTDRFSLSFIFHLV